MGVLNELPSLLYDVLGKYKNTRKNGGLLTKSKNKYASDVIKLANEIARED